MNHNSQKSPQNRAVFDRFDRSVVFLKIQLLLNTNAKGEVKREEVISIARLQEDRERIVASIGVAGLWGHVSFFLGVIFAVLGVIGDAANVTLGLEPMSWFLLAIVASVLSIPWFIGLAMAWYLSTTEAKSEKEELTLKQKKLSRFQVKRCLSLCLGKC